MGNWLVVTREVQVNVGHLVTMEAQEGFKWDVLPVFNHHDLAVRTLFIRQVKTGGVFAVFKKF